MRRLLGWAACILTAASAVGSSERINQEGRILGAVPVVTNATLFNTAQADNLVSAMQILPVTSAWNEDVSRLPLLPNSDAMIAQISADLASSRRTLRAFQEMNYVLVPDSQPMVPISFVDYPDESDPSPYPIPSNMPIETWPTGTGLLTLQQWQADVNNTGGDRHSIVVQPGAGWIWETWQAQLVGTNWQASNGAKFDLKSNAMRPAGWTSGDAAGLPMFPGLPRFDECERGMVEHACRLVVYRTRKEYIYPANHWASTTAATQTNVPAMGQRLRLKSGFLIPNTWSVEEKAILRALKKYGALVADNGGFFSISVTPDDRWSGSAFAHISSVGITNFEVVQGTGPTQGPRSAGAPSANAGPDQTVGLNKSAQLAGYVNFTGTRPTILWKSYSGPGAVSFADVTQTNTMASFAAAGKYVLMLSADDGVHAVAYDAINITVTTQPVVSVSTSGAKLNLSWAGGASPYVVEQASVSSTGPWVPISTNLGSTLSLYRSNASGFYRVRSN